MPSLRPSYIYAKKTRGNSQKSPTLGCADYALTRWGWRNKLRRLRKHLTRLTTLQSTRRALLSSNNYPDDLIEQRLTGLLAETRRTQQHITRVELQVKS